jgi:tRNA A-37 threonylcarbamoyl transferase component Bud32
MVDSANRPRTSKEVRQLSADMARIGNVVSGRYELLELLGHGGMGAVYKARHLGLDRIIAIKFLLSEVADDPVMRSRFLREATASGKINHPNVVQLVDYGESPDGDAYIVVEFLDGIGLDRLIRREKQIEHSRAVNIFEQICDGVAAAHGRGIIHRDLKPSNVMLVEENGEPDCVKILDFGLAKACEPEQESQRLTLSGEVFGSPFYMSPEQCMGKRLDLRADVYAMGVLMYETLTGKLPIAGANVGETIARQLQEIPKPFAEMRPDLQIPAGLEAVVMKAMEKDADLRQSSMLELKQEIWQALLSGSGQITSGPAAGACPVPSGEEPQPVKGIRKSGAGAEAAMPSPVVPGRSLPLPVLVLAISGLLLLTAGAVVCLLSLNHANQTHVRGTGLTPVRRLLPQRAAHGNNSPPVRNGAEKTTAVAEPAQGAPAKAQTEDTAPEKTQIENPPLPALHPKTAVRRKIEAVLSAVRKEETIKVRKVRPRLLTTLEKPTADVDLPAAVSGRRHRRDWQDYSYGVEKKEDYSHSWSVPLAGSKAER